MEDESQEKWFDNCWLRVIQGLGMIPSYYNEYKGAVLKFACTQCASY